VIHHSIANIGTLFFISLGMRCLPKDVPQLRAKINLLGISKSSFIPVPGTDKSGSCCSFFSSVYRIALILLKKKKELCVR